MRAGTRFLVDERDPLLAEVVQHPRQVLHFKADMVDARPSTL
jgi:hypothetical protein